MRRGCLNTGVTALYITKLPKAEHDGPKMFARIGVMRALYRGVERVFDSSKKYHHWGKRKLARDR
jgi:hypothetical protein